LHIFWGCMRCYTSSILKEKKIQRVNFSIIILLIPKTDIKGKIYSIWQKYMQQIRVHRHPSIGYDWALSWYLQRFWFQIRVLFLNASTKMSALEYPIPTPCPLSSLNTHTFSGKVEIIYLIFSNEVQNIAFLYFLKGRIYNAKLKEYLARKFLLPDYEIKSCQQ